MTTLILCSIASLILGLASLIPAMMSPMLFDAPGSEKILCLKGVFAGVLALPLCLIIGSLSAPLAAYFYGMAIGWVVFFAMAKAVGAALGAIVVFGLLIGLEKRLARGR